MWWLMLTRISWQQPSARGSRSLSSFSWQALRCCVSGASSGSLRLFAPRTRTAESSPGDFHDCRLLAPCSSCLAGVLAVGLVVLTLLVGSTAVVAVNLTRGTSFDCGCFRSLSTPIEWPTVARNIVLALSAVLAAASPAKLALWPLGARLGPAPFVPTIDVIAVVIVAGSPTMASFALASALRVRDALTSYKRLAAQ